MMNRVILALVLAPAMCLGAEADLPARADLLFYASFDKSMGADLGRGPKEPLAQKGTGAAEGVSGGAARFHRDEGVSECSFRAEGGVDFAQGTVAFHFKPNWSGSEYAIRTLFSFPGPKNTSGGANAADSLTLFTFRYQQPLQELWLWLDDAGGGNHTTKARIAEWKKGEWHHVAATWDATNLEIYIDGELKARKRLGGAIGAPGDRFYIGTGRNGRDNADGIIDEFCIYRRPLTAGEIGLLTGRPEFLAPRIQALTPRQNIFYTTERFVPFQCEVGGKVSSDTHELEAVVASSDGKTIARATEKIGLPICFLRATISLEGVYVLRAQLREVGGGKVADAREVPLRFIKGPF